MEIREFVKDNLIAVAILKGLNMNNRRCNLRAIIKYAPNSEGVERQYFMLILKATFTFNSFGVGKSFSTVP